MGSQDRKKKKAYSAPTLKELTPEQSKKLVVERKRCSDEEVDLGFLKSVSKQSPNEATDRKRKRSA